MLARTPVSTHKHKSQTYSLHSFEIALTIQISYMQPNYWPRKATQHQMARNTSIGSPAK